MGLETGRKQAMETIPSGRDVIDANALGGMLAETGGRSRAGHQRCRHDRTRCARAAPLGTVSA